MLGMVFVRFADSCFAAARSLPLFSQFNSVLLDSRRCVAVSVLLTPFLFLASVLSSHRRWQVRSAAAILRSSIRGEAAVGGSSRFPHPACLVAEQSELFLTALACGSAISAALPFACSFAVCTLVCSCSVWSLRKVSLFVLCFVEVRPFGCKFSQCFCCTFFAVASLQTCCKLLSFVSNVRNARCANCKYGTCTRSAFARSPTLTFAALRLSSLSMM